MLKRGLNRGLQVIASLAVSSAIFLGGQGVAMAEIDITNNNIVDNINSAVGLAAVGGMQSSTLNAAEINNNSIISYLSATNMDENANGKNIWVEYIHNNSRVNDSTISMQIDGYDDPAPTSLISFDNEVNGIVIGTDFINEENKHMGIAFNYGEGYVDSESYIAITRNDYDYWGMSVYENWKLEKVNIIADLGYMKNSGKIKQINNDMNLKADVDSKVLTAGVRGEFTTNISGLNPYLGLRYVRLTTDCFSANSDDKVIFNAEKDTQNLMLLPVGLKWSHKDTTERGYWKQTVSAGMVYAFGDTDGEAKVNLQVSGDLKINSLNFEVKDSRTFFGSLGLEGRNDDLTYGVRYQFQESTHEINNGIVVNMQYAF